MSSQDLDGRKENPDFIPPSSARVGSKSPDFFLFEYLSVCV